MFNLEKTLKYITNYNSQRDFYLRAFSYSIPLFLFIEFLRNQLSEIDFLQLIPGFYLLLLLSLFIFLIFFSDFFLIYSIESDIKKEIGTKTSNKLIFLIFKKLSFLIFFFVSLFLICVIIPLSLESFNSYGEETLENLWSFDEVLNLETILFFLLIILSQTPIFFLTSCNTEIQIKILPELWKYLTFFICVFSGILTPTIDAYTQLNFCFATLFLYSLIIFISKKRLQIKDKGYYSLNS
jgi:hypothetical protein